MSESKAIETTIQWGWMGLPMNRGTGYTEIAFSMRLSAFPRHVFKHILFIVSNVRRIRICTESNRQLMTELKWNVAGRQERHTMTRRASYVRIHPASNCNYIVKNWTKNYRRKELSRISPSVIYGLSGPREHLLSVGDLVWWASPYASHPPESSVTDEIPDSGIPAA